MTASDITGITPASYKGSALRVVLSKHGGCGGAVVVAVVGAAAWAQPHLEGIWNEMKTGFETLERFHSFDVFLYITDTERAFYLY